MGQYHILINLTKHEFIHPHQIGNGLKLLEQVGFDYSTSTALTMMLAATSGRGGGDFAIHPLIGSWAGDEIAFIGDYAEKNRHQRRQCHTHLRCLLMGCSRQQKGTRQ